MDWSVLLEQAVSVCQHNLVIIIRFIFGRACRGQGGKFEQLGLVSQLESTWPAKYESPPPPHQTPWNKTWASCYPGASHTPWWCMFWGLEMSAHCASHSRVDKDTCAWCIGGPFQCWPFLCAAGLSSWPVIKLFREHKLSPVSSFSN